MRDLIADFALSIAALPATAQDLADLPTRKLLAEIAHPNGLSSPFELSSAKIRQY
ncbi:hypothetical protein [Octadecabacter antarcticus]|uniref:hypothetical protein n=1 Tax=Octadecabacter antarcticus TaxID=1217908 RepID=UPI0001806576|nr:hypothetical protein [Octadecabacter antarcticus]